jgi:hypothetical protein
LSLVRWQIASLVRWQIASTAPVESRIPNSSPASSVMSRREIRLRAVNVTTAACRLGPNAEPPIPSGNPAVVLVRRARGCQFFRVS